MNYRHRDTTYIFTVTKGQLGEDFFKKLRKYRPAGVQLYRMGRNRNRKQLTRCRHQGRLPLELSDRWDLYVRVPYSGQLNTWANHKAVKSQEFIIKAISVISEYKNTIEYANAAHKPVFDTVFNVLTQTPVETKTVKMGMEWSTKHNKWEQVYTKVPVLTAAGVPPKCSPSNDDWKNEMTAAINENNQKVAAAVPTVSNKVMNTKTSTWKITLRSEIAVQGDTHSDLIRTLESMGFPGKDLVSYEKVDLHLDLPLIQFSYPQHGDFSNKSVLRKVRVTKMDDKMIEGFEGSVWKKFFRSKIGAPIHIVEIPQKA